ncbi:hypothetical protein Smp_197290 [Schistosoma mansoni]|uniref:hypothetical protein n=1 Tax=Schistosoma mansoni TaxID=6183 RepID=UPI00022DC575|nr:hypothetical protein Smp_197290 [Schistosoma mansoni]|eukprot:XP_018651441.1 hypothetical protein Smp_197290 [Schistosoma mansoni]
MSSNNKIEMKHPIQLLKNLSPNFSIHQKHKIYNKFMNSTSQNQLVTDMKCSHVKNNVNHFPYEGYLQAKFNSIPINHQVDVNSSFNDTLKTITEEHLHQKSYSLQNLTSSNREIPKEDQSYSLSKYNYPSITTIPLQMNINSLKQMYQSKSTYVIPADKILGIQNTFTIKQEPALIHKEIHDNTMKKVLIRITLSHRTIQSKEERSQYRQHFRDL